MVVITTDHEGYLLFEKFASGLHLQPDEALRRVLVKGMKTFRSQQFADMVEDYESWKRPFEEYKRDNEVLARLNSQNIELAKLLNATREKGTD